MTKIHNKNAGRVFNIFGEISRIPHSSGDMGKIAAYCTDFAQKLGLKYHRDNADNVIIYKNANMCADTASPVILQGHLDMVCQKSADSNIDFLADPLELIYDGDFLKANGTTLGADNGIAAAMILSLLERNDIPHPPIEAVFTTDEEIGMIGAKKLDCSLLSGKKFINLDSESDDTVTVSCAGGSDFKATLNINRVTKRGTKTVIKISGLKGGHSGVEINTHRLNADILAGRFLEYLSNNTDFDIISVNGGDKANAIPCLCDIEIVSIDPEITKKIEQCSEIIKNEISFNEPDFRTEITVSENKEYSVLDNVSKNDIIYILNCVPNGIMDMSSEIEGLVETSLNLGVLSTETDKITLHFALRSNKQSCLEFLEKRLVLFFKKVNAVIDTFGHYPPWEYKSNSALRNIYISVYKELFGATPKVEAIHAGLECAVFSSSIKDADCIAIGPNIFDAHTVNERLEISSVEKIYSLLTRMLEKLID